MHVHILGICGTFMGSLALLAQAMGHRVTGSDQNVYPPMSTQLEQAGIELQSGYLAEHLQPAPDVVVVGNALKRGMEVIEYLLNSSIPYTSGPQFLAEHLLQHRQVLAVSGTHGKTTTTTMLAWVLQHAGKDAGFLIGGVPQVATDHPLGKTFKQSSHLGKDACFVIEADEYDSAFFDKRSKFIHYRPHTLIINNLEFDHADIFADLAAIQTQFHHVVRTVPSQGSIIAPANDHAVQAALDLGCWTPVHTTYVATPQVATDSADLPKATWQALPLNLDASHLRIRRTDCDAKQTTQPCVQEGEIRWQLSGQHNAQNALACVAAAHSVGVPIDKACAALSEFAGIKRRMERLADLDLLSLRKQVQVFDDFAHHPTAIATTLAGARARFGQAKVWAIIEPRSNTMKMGVHKQSLVESTKQADAVIWYEPAGLGLDLSDSLAQTNTTSKQMVLSDLSAVVSHVCEQIRQDDQPHHILIVMSNGSFGGVHQKLIDALKLLR